MISLYDFTLELRKEFERRLQEKTGWGRKEVLHLFDQSVNQTLALALKSVAGGRP